MKKVAVVLSTHSSYIDVCMNFLELFNRNWSDCGFDFWILVIGSVKHVEVENLIEYEEGNSLPSLLYDFMNKHSEYELFISFLGDAFITERIDSTMVNSLINDIKKNNINYCCLIPRKPFRLKKTTCGEYMRFISDNDVYSMSFVAFIATRIFIEKEFVGNISDLEFEEKYLSSNTDIFLTNRDKVILTKNIFNIKAGIDAGKWNNHIFRKLKRKYPEIDWAKRERTPVIKMIFNDCSMLFQNILSKKQRKFIKKMLNVLFHKEFVTKY